MKFLPCWGAALVALAAPAAAQEPETDVYDGDYLAIGAGVAYGPSYDGSDDLVPYFTPLAKASFRGIDFNPRSGGLAIDFLTDPPGNMGYDLGIAGRLRQNRTGRIEDPVVESLGLLKTAVEIGPTAGVTFEELLSPYDTLSFGMDVRWDVAGAHGGMVVEPSVTYATPLSRGVLASLSFGAEYANADFRDYYYSISPEQSAASGLSAFDARSSGFNKVRSSLLLGFDLGGDLSDGGFGVIVMANYARMLDVAAHSPVTSVRGSEDQFMLLGGIGYVF